MIAAAKRFTLVDSRGEPLIAEAPRMRRELDHDVDRRLHNRRPREIQARFDAAQNSDEFINYWSAADHYDADSAHSKCVRDRLVSRSRYEVGNNGYVDGIVQTHANFLVGVGPKLRMRTRSVDFNRQVERAWRAWAKRVQLRRKLWCMAHAKVQDGEAFGVLRVNPALRNRVQLDIALIETEQCQTPGLPGNFSGKIDGIRFDAFGNAVEYDVLRQHPGSALLTVFQKPEPIAAKWMLHWFLLRRPGQHRAIPEFRSTLNVGAGSRRWREATVGAAETAADLSVMFETDLVGNDGADPLTAMSSLPFQKRMAVASPFGWKAKQLEAKHPNAQYEAFHRAQLNEQARPKNMPYNIAACDSSSYNFASGKLDHQTYFGSIDCEREDANDLVLDKVFDLWFELAALVYGWDLTEVADDLDDEVPSHDWDWPQHPIADAEGEANARDTNLKNGTLSPSEDCSNQGLDFEDHIDQLAQDYGVTVEEMKAALLRNNLAAAFINSGTPPAASPSKRRRQAARKAVSQGAAAHA